MKTAKRIFQALFFFYFVPRWFYKKRKQLPLIMARCAAFSELTSYVSSNNKDLWMFPDEIKAIRRKNNELESILAGLKATRKKRKREIKDAYMDAAEAAEDKYKKEHPGFYFDPFGMNDSAYRTTASVEATFAVINSEMEVVMMQLDLALAYLNLFHQTKPEARKNIILKGLLIKFLDAARDEIGFSLKENTFWFMDEDLLEKFQTAIFLFGDEEIKQEYEP